LAEGGDAPTDAEAEGRDRFLGAAAFMIAGGAASELSLGIAPAGSWTAGSGGGARAPPAVGGTDNHGGEDPGAAAKKAIASLASAEAARGDFSSPARAAAPSHRTSIDAGGHRAEVM
jgi:hypothetical protein